MGKIEKDDKNWFNGLKVEGLNGINKRTGRIEGWKTRGIEGWPFKRDRGLEGWKASLLTLNSYTSIPLSIHTSKKRYAFTMAEILVSLTIIGIVAVITLPSLVGNIKEKSWAAQKKALYSRMSQAIGMLPSMNGYGEFTGEWADDVVTPQVDTAAETFITDGLSKVLQINNICTVDKLKDCGISDKITTMGNSKIDFPKKLSELNPYFTKAFSNFYWNFANPQKNIDTKVAAFETKNGESVAVFYNPYCVGSDIDNKVANGPNQHDFVKKVQVIFPWMCANFVYDLNGKKGPNKVGKDIGIITALYPTDTVVTAPMPAVKNAVNPLSGSVTGPQNGSQQACLQQNKDSRVPTIEEAMVLQLGAKLYNIGGALWTNKTKGSNSAYFVDMSGMITFEGKGQPYKTRCVKR